MDAQVPKLPVLSYTNLSTYQTCPRRFHHMYVLKDLPYEEKSKEQLYGTEVHEALKKRVRLNEPLPADFSKWEPLAGEICNQPYVKHTEMKLGIHHDGGPCDFFADGVWLRGALDLVLAGPDQFALLLDWKTGKTREDPFELHIQALLLKTAWPELKRISGHYVWLSRAGLGIGADDLNGMVGVAHDCSDTDKTLRKIKELETSLKRRLVANDWPPDEGPLCGWCPVPKSKCEFKRERK